MSQSIMTFGACVTSAVPHALTTCHYTARDYYNVSIGFQMSVSDTPLDRAQVAPGISTTSTPTYEMMGLLPHEPLTPHPLLCQTHAGPGPLPAALPRTMGAQSASGSSCLLSCYPGWVECHLFSKKPEVTEAERACLLRDAATGQSVEAGLSPLHALSDFSTALSALWRSALCRPAGSASLSSNLL